MSCPECYSEQPRITPLLKPKECLEKHQQYICGTCGRCICIQADEKRGVRRWQFPFKTAEIAKLYLRTADITTKTACGIYEVISDKGRRSYKIFANQQEFESYLKTRNKSTTRRTPIYQQPRFETFPQTEIRYLTAEETANYLKEQQLFLD